MTAAKSSATAPLRSSDMTPQTRRRFAQHFLEDSWVERIIDLIEPKPADTIIEIGPGRGALTTSLVRSGATVVAVEIDRDLARALQSAAEPNLTVVPQDFLTLDLESLPVDMTGARSSAICPTAWDPRSW